MAIFPIILLLAGVVAAIVITAKLWTKVIPAEKDGAFTDPRLQKLHDYFNFKKLYIEVVLKALFTFASVTCVVYGIIIVIFGVCNLLTYLVAGEFSAARILSGFLAVLLVGAATAGLGPVILRLTYEGAMMFILLVKNVMELNNKTLAPKTPVAEEVPHSQE